MNKNSLINSFINCSNYTPSGYIFENYTYKPCYSTCKECVKIGDNYNHQCSKCIDNYYFYNTNCYENCTYYYYFDDLHIHHCTKENNCPENKSKLIKEKGECVNDSIDNIYTYEYNNEKYTVDTIKYYYVNITKTNFIDNFMELNYSDFMKEFKMNNLSKADEKLNDIRNILKNGSMNSLISKKIEGDKEDLFIRDDNLIIQITSSENQIKNKNDDTSTILLGECENILKSEYNIDKDMALTILKIDYYQPGL